jgi:hypothetical protein
MVGVFAIAQARVEYDKSLAHQFEFQVGCERAG